MNGPINPINPINTGSSFYMVVEEEEKPENKSDTIIKKYRPDIHPGPKTGPLENPSHSIDLEPPANKKVNPTFNESRQKIENNNFKKITGKKVEDKTFFTKAVDLLHLVTTAPGALVMESLKTPEGRKKLLVLALATGALLASAFATGGGSVALFGLCIAGVALASCDLVHLQLSGDKRFAGDTIGSAINYFLNLFLDLLCRHESPENKDTRRATVAKCSHLLSVFTRLALSLAQLGVSSVSTFDPSFIKSSDAAKVLSLIFSALKPIAEGAESLIKIPERVLLPQNPR